MEHKSSAGREPGIRLNCTHPRDGGLPCAHPHCARGTWQRNLTLNERVYLRAKSGDQWVWKVSGAS